MNMITRSYTVRFLTPAFLGDAEQNGAWRTPPFKALLRQWWRVAYMKGRAPTAALISQMRDTEGRLFGNAWLEANDDDLVAGRKVGHCRSLVRMRLTAENDKESWTRGTQQGVAPLTSSLDTSYSWFGLIKRKDRVTKAPLPDRTGIKPNKTEGECTLRLAFPIDRAAELDLTLQLINTFGQLGSRARTGWGAVQIAGVTALSVDDVRALSRAWRDCFAHDWAHAIGADEHGSWVWESPETFNEWAAALTRVAGLRKAVRTSLKEEADMRPLLGFAAEKDRMPSPLRWRVFPANGNTLRVRVFALPHKIPAEAGKDAVNRYAETAWTTVTRMLDQSWLERVH